MLVSIESDIKTFKSLRFHAGLNVLLADSRPASTDKHTRNSAGKTSFVEIVHFLLGSEVEKDSLFRSEPLVRHSFAGTFKIAGQTIRVRRSGDDPSKIFAERLDGTGHDDLPTRVDKSTGRNYVSYTNWKSFLGSKMFGLPSENRGTAYDQTYSPTFRSLFSYFARRRNAGGFSQPEKNAEMQQRVGWQVCLSYMIGLDWQIAIEFQNIRDRERLLEDLKKAARQGALGPVVGTVAELRPQVRTAEVKAQRLREQVTRFQVLESYREQAERAARAKTEMQRITRELVPLHERLQHLDRSLQTERPPDRDDLRKLYAAVGVEMPGVALRRFDEVEKFHQSVVQNRRSHLEQEVLSVQQEIGDKESRLQALDTTRSQILLSLQGRGALEDFVRLQRDLSEAEVLAATLQERFQAAQIIEGTATKLDLDRINLKLRLQKDQEERHQALDAAILLIGEEISELYDDRTGGLVVEATDNGPEFRISIEGDRGGGISNMEIFCLDLMLLTTVAKRFGGPGFLVHDSHLFDGVDQRQIARALLLGARRANTLNCQYIVTMNSDVFDRLPLSKEIDRAKVVLSTRLSDETEAGGLFGFRFD